MPTNSSNNVILEKLDELHAGFDKLQGGFDKLHVGFDKLQESFDGLQGGFDRLQVGFKELSDTQTDFSEALHALSDHMDEQFVKMATKEELAEVKERLIRVEANMATKSFVQDQIGDLRADLIVLSRKANTKLSVLIDSLVKEGAMKRATADRILAMEPFAQ